MAWRGYSWMATLVAQFVALAGLGLPAPAWGLSVEQVLALKKAGVGEKTIQALIQAENAAQARGATGVYTLRPFAGREWIVYEASSPLGVEEYPLDLDPAAPDLSRVAQTLGARPAQNAPTAPVEAGPRTQAHAGGAGYALLLASHEKRARAEAQVRELVASGLLARLLPVQEPGQDRRYLVLAGSYPDQAEARAQGERLRQEGRVGEFQVIGQ
jgi:cell division septation protein DedD